MKIIERLNVMADAIIEVDPSFLEEFANMILDVSRQSRKVILAGNGASAAIASHVSVDMTKAAGVRAVNFNEVDLITCFSNDYGYDQWILEALKAYADPGDLVILISSSGMSMNMVNAATYAKTASLQVVTLSGFNQGNKLSKLGHINLWVDSRDYNVVETAHQSWLLAVVDELEEKKKARN